MAFGTIKMDKVSEEAMSAVYKVSTDDYAGSDFYVRVDKESQAISFYLDQGLAACVYIIDSANKDQPIKNIPGVHKIVLMGSISKALKIMKAESFPDKVGYSA